VVLIKRHTLIKELDKRMKGSDLRTVVELVRERTDIVQVIGQCVPLDRHYKALCPFHEEKVPSFSVNAQGQYFYCFGCGKGGDVFAFLQLRENKSFMEVLSELAEKAGISMPTLTPEARQSIKEDRMIEDILTESARFYHQSVTDEAKAYLLNERGLTQEIISRFQIGFAKGGLRQHLMDECKFPLDVCLKAGVLREKDGAARDYFYQRIIFPNISRGRVVHLSGRSLGGHEPKYLHLPGEIRYLYNEDALSSNEIYVAEGILDCLSAVQAGFPAVAIFGSHNLKPEQTSKLSRCDAVYLCFDGDEAGREGALKIGGLIGEKAKIVSLPEGLDLNDYLKSHTKEDFAALTSSALDIVKYELSLVAPDTDKTDLPDRLASVLKKLAQMDKAKAEAYLNHAIKSRFNLRKKDIDGYRELVGKFRDQSVQAPNIRVSGREAETVYTANLDGLVDLVEHEGSPGFLMKDGDRLSVLPKVERDGVVYVPPPRQQIPWLLPRATQVLELFELEQSIPQSVSDGALYDDLWAYHKTASELPREEYYDLIVAWDFHTYLPETVEYSPIVCLFAVPERGKSRTGKGMIYVAYRGIHVESLRDPYLVRVASDLGASIFFDVRDIWRKAEKNGSEDILLNRFERGMKVPRVLYPDRGPHRDIVYYSIFGPTIISTNEGAHRILETRAITINMPETGRRFENDVTPELARPLRERLVAFRARHLGELLPDTPKPASGRLGDILKPLLQVIRLVKPEREGHFLKLVKELEAERLIEKASSLEAEILGAVLDLESQLEHGMLPVKLVTDTLNLERPEKRKLSYQLIGRRLSAMGLRKATTPTGAAAILWSQEQIERMKNAYGVRKTSVTSATSETPEKQTAVTDVTEDSDVCQRVL
jgi:DNA primase catalytic core